LSYSATYEKESVKYLQAGQGNTGIGQCEVPASRAGPMQVTEKVIKGQGIEQAAI